MSSRRAVWLTARREIRARIAMRSFQIGTALMVASVVALSVVVELIGSGSPDRIGLSGDAAALSEPLRVTAAALDEDVEPVTVDAGRGTEQVRDGDLDAFVSTTPDGLRVVVDEDLDDGLRSILAALARERALDEQVRALGGDPAEVDRRLAEVRLDVQALDPQEAHAGERLAIGMIVGILVYLSLLIYGQVVAQGVVEEKATRVVELLLATIQAWQLMAGKVLGIGVVALAQLAAVLAAGVAAALLTGALDLPASVAIGSLVWSVVWFMLGFFLYALLFAAAGALVSRQEDVGGVTTPLTMAIVIPYVVGISVLPSDPDSGLVAGLSLLPPFAPLLMPMRLAVGGVPAAEVALALVLTVATVALLVRVAGRVYSSAVRRSGARISVRDALRAG